MKIKIDKYEYSKVLVKNVELNIPEENIAYQEYNGSKLTLLLPQFMSNGELYKLKIIQIHTDYPQIITSWFNISKTSLESLLLKMDKIEYKDTLEIKVLKWIIENNETGKINIDIFKTHYNNTVKILTEQITQL